MLQSLYIKNFAIFDEISIQFSTGFTVITGETGAGKSMLANSLLFLMGQKAEPLLLKNKEKKAIVEAVFINSPIILDFLKANEIDITNEIILRRELLPSGTSRGFINDQPVSLSLLKEALSILIDIHSQHQNLLLKQQSFQIHILDVLADQKKDVNQYKQQYFQFLQKKRILSELREQQNLLKKEYDYLLHQLNELSILTKTPEEFEQIEKHCQILENIDELLAQLVQIVRRGKEDDPAILTLMKNTIRQLQHIKYHKATIWLNRLNQIYYDFKDILDEIEHEIHQLQSDPVQLQEIQQIRDQVYRLIQKHKASSYSHLIEIKKKFEEQLFKIQNIDDDVNELEKEINELYTKLRNCAQKLHENRIKASKQLTQKIIPLLSRLGMKHAHVSVKIDMLDDITESGISSVAILFSANPKVEAMPVEKIASGGELSRFMLSLKSIIAQQLDYDTLLFDEIDTGISGEIAFELALLMSQLSQNIQVISITHLPQVAALGHQHFAIIKHIDKGETLVDIRLLTQEERIYEIAKMISGKEITTSAIDQAKHLLSIKTK